MKTAKAITVAVLLTILVCIGMAWIFSSCELTKKSSSDMQNNSAVKKMDSGTVKKNEVTETNDKQYQRETWGFMPNMPIVLPGKSDTINNYYNTTEKLLQPIYYSRETGTEKNERREFNYDSAFHSALDSMNKNRLQESSSTKFEGLNMWQIIGIVLGISLLMKIIPFPFKITKA